MMRLVQMRARGISSYYIDPENPSFIVEERPDGSKILTSAADAVMVFDNSESTGPLLRLQIDADAVVHNQLDAARWLDRRIASVVAR